ncbi:protein transport protein Sec31A isoform X2 [Anabrus simplex]|uniref:protein transport protein Sec31A isoform X2 n=1 Tax=Anabrus simplex TaxID=316456 RepID=UPI0035A3CC28
MKVKELDRTVNIAWSPASMHPILLAAGTAAQQLDASFSTSAAMELYALNLTEPGIDMDLRASAPSDYRFHKIAWGQLGAESEKGAGVIVGGCDGGRIQLYSAAKLLAGEEGLIVSQEKHTGPVHALDFNPYQGNLLATGASESEIYIWDLNNINSPMTPGAKSQPHEDVIWIAWNRQVQHILASAFPQRCVMWDLRKNEPIIKLSDSTTRIRWKVLAWHPEVATQLCLASEEDQNPVIQLWDLRFATSPLKVLQNHQRGVLSIAWCSQDPDLLASCGKDNRILCWNPNSNFEGGEVVCDITTTYQWNFDVSWCPRNPALISSSSFDGHVSVYSLTGGQQQVQTSNKIADSFPGMENFAQAPLPLQQPVSVDLRKAPKWLKRPVGASFGFGGKLVMFENVGLGHGSANQVPQAPVGRTVYISQVVTEPELIARSNQLESALQYGQFIEFCQTKAASSKTPHEQYVWNFIRANFEEQPRAELLRLLGFESEDIISKLNRFIDKPANARPSDGIDGLSDQMRGLGREAPEGDAAATFDAIAAENHLNNLDSKPVKPFKICTGDDTDGLICQALLLGYTEAAVELCLQDGRMADAIILAMTGGEDLLAKTQHRYLQQNTGYLSSLINAVVTEDWSQVIQSCEVESWKEAMAAILTQAKGSDEYPALCEQLGLRLEMEGKGMEKLSAQLCYICAGNLGKLVENWTTVMKPDSPNKLQDLVELVMVLRKAAERQGRTVEMSGHLANLLSQYAAILAAQGNLNAALTYLGDSNEEQIASLRERLYRALGHKPAYTEQQMPAQQQPQVLGRIPTSRRQSASYYPGHASQSQNYTSSSLQAQPVYGMQQQQQQQQHQQPVSQPPSSAHFNPSGQPFPNPTVTSQPYPVQKSYTPAPPVNPPVQTYNPPPVPTFPPASAAPTPNPPSQANNSSMPRNKPYMVDPSVQSSPAVMPYGAPQANQFVPAAVPQQPSMYPGAPVGNPTVPSYPSSQIGTGYTQQDAYRPGDVLGSTNPITPQDPRVGSTLPGWNDPPVIKNSARNQPKSDYTPQAPITHPLYGSIPQEALPSNMPPNMAMNGGFMDPSNPYNQVHQQSQQFQPQQQQQLMQPLHQQQQQQPVAPAKVAEPPKPKGPVPEEHMYLQTVFDELRNRCLNAASNPQSRRKLEDVARKLEVLYDSLRENKLSPTTLQGLHQMVQMVQIGDYPGGLGLHTQLASGPDFSQIASFMPGLKVLMQSALQLQVYLQ